MSLRDRVEKLIGCLERSGTVLAELAEKMRAQRRAFASLRGDEVASAVESLQSLAEAARKHDKEREAIVAELEQLLQTGKPIDVTRILPHVPRDLARRLDAARGAAKRAAIALRSEAAIGQRLLEFGASIQETLMKRFLKLQDVETRGYDRHARLTKSDPTSGRLVKGVL